MSVFNLLAKKTRVFYEYLRLKVQYVQYKYNTGVLTLTH